MLQVCEIISEIHALVEEEMHIFHTLFSSRDLATEFNKKIPACGTVTHTSNNIVYHHFSFIQIFI